MSREKLNELRNKIGIDGAIIAVALCVFITAVTLLLTDDDAVIKNGNEFVAVGRFSTSKNDVRRRVESGFSWGNISKTDVVYEGDSIFTGEDSAASVELEKGSKLNVEPNSLVVIRTRGSAVQFDLQYGSLFGKVAEGQTLVIMNNGEAQEITGQDAEIQVISQGPNKETKVQVLKGEINLTKSPKPGSTAKAATKIKKDEVAHIDVKGQAEVKRTEISLVSPKPGSTFWLSLGAVAPFSWTRSGSTKTEPVKFQLARDAEFKTIVLNKVVDGDLIELTPDQRPEGRFFWRVIPTEKNLTSLPTLPARISILPDEPPIPRQPVDRQELAYNSQMNETGKAVLMSWEDKADSTDYEVEIAKDEAFTTVVYKKSIEKIASDNSAALPIGTYFWRVKGLHAERKNSPWSRLSTFTVIDDAKVPAKPILLISDLKFEIPVDALKSMSPAQLASNEEISVDAVSPFMWRTAQDAESYEVELAETADFKNSTKIQLGEETTYSLPKVRPGVVFARVRGVTKKGFAGAPSAPAKLEVSVAAPVLEKIAEIKDVFTNQKEFDEAKREVKLSWTPRPFAKSYELQWAADSSFKRLKKYKISGTSRVQTVSVPMDYHARVRALDGDGKPVSAFSAARVTSYRKTLNLPPPSPKLVVAPKPKLTPKGSREPAGALIASLPRPGLLEPQPDTSLITLENSKSYVNFRWKAVANTDEYQVQIASDPDFDTVVGEVWTKNTRSVFQKRLPEGKVYWRVRSVTKKGYSNWSNAFNINVLYE